MRRKSQMYRVVERLPILQLIALCKAAEHEGHKPLQNATRARLKVLMEQALIAQEFMKEHTDV